MLWIRGGWTLLGLAVIGLLLAAWAIVLVPSISLRRSPVDGVRSFERFMGVLANTRHGQVPGRWIMVPPDPNGGMKRRRERVLRRRRQVFQRLIVAAGVTLLLGVVPWFRALLLAHVACDVVLAAYVVQLRRWNARETQRMRVLRRVQVESPREELHVPREELLVSHG